MARTDSIKTWNTFFKDVGLEPALSDAYSQYASHLLGRNVPVIFEFGHLAAILGRTESYIASVINAPEKHYREFEIPKRKGGKRTITAPYPSLLECQQWIKVRILDDIPLHPNVHGFATGRSILSNARKHVGQNEILAVDVKDFFSINLD